MTAPRYRRLKSDRDDLRIATLAALALAIHVAEAALPSPLPGIKPGLANIITVAACWLYGWRVAVWITVLRVLAGGILMGTLLSPTFFLSLAGGLGALGGLALARTLPGASAVSYSLLAALAHMGAQFTAAWWLFIPHPGLWLLFPPFMTAAIVFGLVNGIMASAMIRELGRPPRRDGHEAA
ncbi:Gx transporter family protein [Alkalilimnicola ehrlichii MLHE-1]|uniref:Heptaprenyl diphosphate synthase component I n=1 Tax=Alkalilimnicola ehrlichii (strain ATCC BAA-1101 / DSM 17681 / MLHE-1) TaxID=187272 RepID=Q0ABT1_ALKEH|nr:Gx transporter family protein [Alkalilimnicola ehrlichii]ABI55706.1 Heptaprenyl diphosphate synthase component I [Alkalilimnicola ehrlichii MLHE-1]